MIIDIIASAKKTLSDQGIKPTLIKMSPSAHQMLADELKLNEGNNKRYARIFELMGLRIDIDDECPAGAAYIEGME
jgi:hypothetical protein